LAINPCSKVITALANFLGFNQLTLKLPPSFFSFQALGKTVKNRYSYMAYHNV